VIVRETQDTAESLEPKSLLRFDSSPLKVTLRARNLRQRAFCSEEECREAYFKAPRALLQFEITR
jgi:hypothetical protein